MDDPNSSNSSQRAPRVRRHPNPLQQTVKYTRLQSSTGTANRAATATTSAIDDDPVHKKAKLNTASSAPHIDAPSPSAVQEEEPELSGPTASRKKGASSFMKEFKPYFDELEQAIFERHHFAPGTSRNCACGKVATSRCAECFDPTYRCHACALETHREMPFHWLEEWNGQFFVKRDLGDLGLVIGLGDHGGDVCPHGPSENPGKDMVIVHTNGVHKVRVVYCHCVSRRSRISQLMGASLFPATTKEPSTLFTFAVLKHFHILNLQSKTTPYDYFYSLRRLTDNAFPDQVPDRYREFLRITRVWRYLTSRKRSGQAHGIDRLLPHRTAGSVAPRCWACPEDKFNMPLDWEKTDIKMRHKHTLYWSVDGTHSLTRKNKRDDPDDVSLTDGSAFFVKDDEFQEYLKNVKPTEEKSNCSELKAVNMQNKKKLKGMVVTGVVACCCRHGCFVPNAMVDLQKGERFANTDYALSKGLLDRKTMLWIVLTYDIGCQYCIYLLKRFMEEFPDEEEMIRRILVLVPKMHLYGHKEDCQYRFSCNYTEGLGRTHGEVIETLWGNGREAKGSTQEMNAGHRHDTLDDHHADSNFRKNQGRAVALRKAFVDSHQKLDEKEVVFNGLSKNTSADRIAEWSEMDDKPYMKDGEWHSVYRPAIGKSLTQAQVLMMLLEQESAADQSTRTGKGSYKSFTIFLAESFRVQLDQLHVMQRLKDAADSSHVADIAQKRARLVEDIASLRKFQYDELPLMRKFLDGLEVSDNPETETLYLPSDFDDPEERTRMGLSTLATQEAKLRIAQAQELLQTVRETVKAQAVHSAYKRQHIRGQKDNTRAQSVLKRLAKEAEHCADRYRVAWRALENIKSSLDGDGEEAAALGGLRKLTNDELWMKNQHVAHELGDGRKTEPWYWWVGAAGEGSAQWSIEADRVMWFRARAEKCRFKEETEIVGEEFPRTHRSLTKMQDIWTELAESCGETTVEPVEQGKRAYAFRQASMYADMAAHCADQMTKAEEEVRQNRSA